MKDDSEAGGKVILKCVRTVNYPEYQDNSFIELQQMDIFWSLAAESVNLCRVSYQRCNLMLR